MDYIKQINAFWEKSSDDDNLKTSSVLVYLALLKINNACGWKEEFAVTYGEVLQLSKISNHKTYYSCLIELVNGGYIDWKKSPNQYKASKIIIKVLYQKTEEQIQSTYKASGRANTKHMEEQLQSTPHIPKHINNKTNKHINNIERGKETQTKFSPPSIEDVKMYFLEKIPESNWTLETCEKEAKKFVNFYESKNWYVGKNKMSKWKNAASGWIERNENFNHAKSTKQSITDKAESRDKLDNLAQNVLATIAAKHGY